MPTLHGFEATIVCDEKELETYGATVNDRTASGWVATEVGKYFAIRVRQVAAGEHPRFLQRVLIDGVQVLHWMGSSPDECTLAGMHPTPTTFKKFQFSALRTTDENIAQQLKNDDEDMGTIKVIIRRRVQVSSTPNMNETLYPAPTAATVHERNKKRILGGQSVSAGPEETVGRVNSLTTEPYDPKDPDPYVTFIFKYRSREYLLAEDIIPHLPAVTPAKRAHTATLSPDEEPDVKPAKRINLEVLEDKQRKIRELKNQLRNIEAEVADELNLPEPDVKREPFPFAVGVVVDLTGPDSDTPPRRKVKKEAEITVGDAGESVIDLTDD